VDTGIRAILRADVYWEWLGIKGRTSGPTLNAQPLSAKELCSFAGTAGLENLSN